MHLRLANAEYYRERLKYDIDASQKFCEVWGAEGRNFDMRRLFDCICVLEKLQFLPQRTINFRNFNDLAS